MHIISSKMRTAFQNKMPRRLELWKYVHLKIKCLILEKNKIKTIVRVFLFIVYIFFTPFHILIVSQPIVLTTQHIVTFQQLSGALCT